MHNDVKGDCANAADTSTDSSRVVASAWLMHENGLHARPAIRLTKLAKRFRANIRMGVTANGPWTDVKSIAKVMAMKAPSQMTLFFEADGDDARSAVDALVALVTNDFNAEDEDATGVR